VAVWSWLLESDCYPVRTSIVHIYHLAVRHTAVVLMVTGKGGTHSNLRDDLPLIAIMAATTTRKIDKPSTKNLSLFMYLLPSLVRTLDCGYRYEYVMGYDKGDPFYDSKEVSSA
jgi:hypothetical protein